MKIRGVEKCEACGHEKYTAVIARRPDAYQRFSIRSKSGKYLGVFHVSWNSEDSLGETPEIDVYFASGITVTSGGQVTLERVD